MGNAELSVDFPADDSPLAEEASAHFRSRGVPADWYVDPADPHAAQSYNRSAQESLEEAATAFLAAHEAADLASEDDGDLDPPLELLAPAPLAVPVWIGLRPGNDDFSDEGELGWQTDALCAQTDPEAFFPEKGGSTRDAKKVCGACNVRAQCLEYALSNDERFGIWGGLSERERRRLRKRAV
ncbi:WhiB family transcriptional regulator [Arthrobacter sp. 35W]|uniref:WhiB family transcriptional regulator n=1 Tax=Arthrobacter sp. 35W TaxID=1132441 RepID=UPI0009DEF3A5|nr:WhiB family transcriptional regulator [Arthrobacter sp. 35W]